jgi:thymidylate synthase (FAD)
MIDTYPVLDKGYVGLVNVMGSDLDVVNAARASFDRQVNNITEKDRKLIEYLIKHKHDSVLRHCTMTFEVYAPMMIKNQWIKHIVASTHLEEQFGWNEVSRRYVVEKPEYYTPKVWSAAPESLKQGAGDPIEDDTHIRELYGDFLEYADNLYYRLMDLGVAPEQARLVLPGYAMYVKWRWTASLQAVLNFVELRLGHGAQNEITAYAEAVGAYLSAYFPITTLNWFKYRVVE